MVRGKYRRKRRIARIKYRIKFLICLFIIVSIYRILFDSYSLYESQANSNADVDVAFFCIDDTYDAKTINIGDIGPDDREKEYKITVSNFIDGYVAETNIKYNLEILTTTNLPLEFKIYTNDGKQKEDVEQKLKDETYQDESNTYFKRLYEEKERLFKKQEQNTQIYTLKVIYPNGDEYKKSEYQNIIECLEVRIHAEQDYSK